jgi:dihydroxyacid dehydratase/phosphogluconate dehydratase
MKLKHQTQTDKRNSIRQHQIIEPTMASASSQREGYKCHITTKSEAEQSHQTCHRKGVLDIAFLTIHVDAGALAFT